MSLAHDIYLDEEAVGSLCQVRLSALAGELASDLYTYVHTYIQGICLVKRSKSSKTEID